MDLNRAQLIGNVTRDPELRTLATGQTVASFGVATNFGWTDAQGQKQQRAEFHNIVAWGKLAEICHQYLTKGKKVFVEGRIQTRDWEAQDGTKKNRTEIVCENMIMLGGGAPAGTTRPTTPSTSAAPHVTVTPVNESEPTIEKSAGDQEIRLEDIPF